MRALLLLVAVAAAIGFASFGAYYTWQSATEPVIEATDELSWLRREFSLSEEELARVEAAHAEFRPVCERLCSRVIEAQDELEAKLLSSSSFDAEVEEALAHFSRVKEECHRAMLQHVYDVAAVMDPEQRQRYLKRAKAHVTMHDAVRP